MLCDDARADSVPNLEIEKNDVNCSHASAWAHRRGAALYLESAGDRPEVAERLLVLGFFSDLAGPARFPGVAR